MISILILVSPSSTDLWEWKIKEERVEFYLKALEVMTNTHKISYFEKKTKT